MRSLRDRYISIQNKKIALLSGEIENLKRENKTLRQNVAEYEHMVQHVRELEAEYIDEIKNANELRNQCKKLLNECRSVQSQLTFEARTLIDELKQ